MASIVKITTFGGLVDAICPHACRGCGRPGSLLCECCKNYNSLGKVSFCPICRQTEQRGICKNCELPFEGVYMCGWRDELLGQMTEEYKYNSVRAMARVLAEVLDDSLPEICGEVVVVPLPTIARHVRERGFDHIGLLAKQLARRRGWRTKNLLVRAANTVQVGANAKKRREQAKKAYELGVKRVKAGTTYLLLDDVWTTGASMLAAEKLLRKAGAKKIIAAVLVVSR